eukprot:6374370-Prymnesium_polylepis.3
MVAPAVALMRLLGKKEMLCVACTSLAIINAGLAMIPAHIVQQARRGLDALASSWKLLLRKPLVALSL